ncbi:APC family permease [Methanoregula sp.]|uniref:APC family permease n=1 Tax=Methanoregula sp. TaxID=2052170 RepID=UPI00236E0DDB|nr:APC family permease [Methanoregula sp.]MDD1687814.1 APC family permease [Methanoregula sp.]
MTENRAYKRSLGLWELVSLGVGGTIGSGIFVVPGLAAGLTGPWSLLAWVIVAISASCVLLSLSSISHRFASEGSFFSLFESVFGARIAVPLIILYLISSVFGVATIAAGIGQYISFFTYSPILIVEIALIVVFCIINIVGISFSGMTENLLTLIKIIPLVVITLLLIPFIRPVNFIPDIPLTATGLLATIIIVYWPFTGFEISAIPVEETKDPSLIRTSLLLVMGIVVSLYLVLNIALIGSMGAASLAASPAPVAAAAGILFTQSGTLVACIGIVAMLSALNAYIVGTSRVLYSLSGRLSIPGLRDLTHRGTPAYALAAGCAASAALLLFSNRFAELATISVITTLIPYIFFCGASWILVTNVQSRLVSAAGAISTAAILAIYVILY